jgi:hypothetical protein
MKESYEHGLYQFPGGLAVIRFLYSYRQQVNNITNIQLFKSLFIALLPKLYQVFVIINIMLL